MKLLDLFSGIGGFSLGLERAGMTTAGFCEIDPFCRKILKKYWPDVPIHDDIKTMRGDEFGPVDVVCGGFPCQPFSCAGKRRGKEDDRYLWPEMLRVVSESKPRWVIGENVAGFIGMGLDDCLSDLENQGYETQAFVIPACAVNAPHRRDRVWILAFNSASDRQFSGSSNQRSGSVQDVTKRTFAESEPERNGWLMRSGQGDCHVTDTGNQRLQGSAETRNYGIDGEESSHKHARRCTGWQEPWLEAATRLCGIFNGVSNFLDEAGGLDGKKSIAVAGQDLPCLWQGFQQESFQWDIGGLDSVQFKANVFTVLWELFRRSYRQDFLSFESAEVQEAYLRNVWIGSEPGCPPQGWGYNEQYTREHSDSLSRLSYEVALATKEVISGYNKNRVNRLKALGNAVVPQIPEIIGRAIMEVEGQ